MTDKPEVPDMSQVDFDTRLKVLLGVLPETEKGTDDATDPPPITESDPDLSLPHS